MNFDEWQNYIHGLPYFERRVKISRAVDPPLSRFLYKYKTVDETNPTTTERLRDILVRSRLWLSSPVDFNDPFDTSAKMIADASPDERLERYKDFIKGRKLRFKERERIRKNFMCKSPVELEKKLDPIYREGMKKMGIFSFAGDARNILMWSHYARDHTGVCLQFERAQDFKTMSGALPVEYSPEYPTVNFIRNFHESLSKAVLRKHEGWSYEKEQRIVRPDLAHSYLPFDPRAIVGIIMGCRSTLGVQAIIESLLEARRRAKMPPVRLYLAQKHSSKYRLVIYRKE